MHLSTDKINKSLRKFIHKRFVDAAYASEEEGLLAVSSLLEAQAAITLHDDQIMYEQLLEILSKVSASLSLEDKAPHLTQLTGALERQISQFNLNQRREFLEAQEKAVLIELEALVDKISTEPALNQKRAQEIAFQIADWDFARINRSLRSAEDDGLAADEEITGAKLEAYLRVRFDDAELEVVNFSKAGGGYGKQTIFFECTGKLSGNFVLRRDRPVAMVDNDCHRVVNEFPVVKAVKKAGFPAPDAMWLEGGHPLLPGANFFVMRRSTGNVQGTVFGGTEALSPRIVTSLAQTVGQLHRLEPLTELGNLNESIQTELWSLPTDEVVRRYIAGYYQYFLKDRVSTVPSLVAVYRWLIANVPPCDERPVLVHGDLGLHNLLFENDKLKVVLDWEMAHIGDPMEDVAYIRNTANASLDWDAFVEAYEAESGNRVNLERVRFQQIWGQARNATGALLSADCYASGGSQDIALAHLGFTYYSTWLGEALKMIKQVEGA